MLDTLPLAQEPGSGDRHQLGLGWTPAPALALLLKRRPQPLEPAQGLGLQATVGQFLQAVGEPALEMAAVEGRRLGSEELAPLRLQFSRGGGLQRRKPRRNGVDVGGHAKVFLRRHGATALSGHDV